MELYMDNFEPAIMFPDFSLLIETEYKLALQQFLNLLLATLGR